MVVAEEGDESLDRDGEADVRHGCSVNSSCLAPDDLVEDDAPAAQRPWSRDVCGMRQSKYRSLVCSCLECDSCLVFRSCLLLVLAKDGCRNDRLEFATDGQKGCSQLGMCSSSEQDLFSRSAAERGVVLGEDVMGEGEGERG